jgi:hypothetical protein
MEAADFKRGIRHCNGKCVQACTSSAPDRTGRVRNFAKWTEFRAFSRGIGFAYKVSKA